jgi:iron complex outermembrane receptor protein
VLHPFAIGGVINIITKKGKKTADLKPDLKLDAGYGSFNTQFGSLGMNGGVGNFLGYNFSYSNSKTDGYLRNNFQNNETINGHLSLYLPKDMQLSFSIKHANVEYGYPVLNDPSRGDYDSDYPTFLGTADQLRHIPPTTQTAGVETPHWKRDVTYLDLIFTAPALGGEFKLHGFSTEGKRWNHYWRSGTFKKDYSGDLTRGVIAQLSDVTPIKYNSLTVGAEFQELGTPDTENQTIGWPEMAAATYRVLSFYAQDVIRYGAWTVTPGVRYYHLNMNTHYSWVETGGTTAAFPTAGKEQSDDGFYPSLKIDFQATQDTAIYAAVSRSYRLPCP